MGFPKDFVWGTATASFQIEGAWDEDGKSPSIWDEYCEQPGKILDGSDGRVACDHYHRFREDIALMAEHGIKHYRFSVSWPRILPDGTGKVNEAGVAFYNQLIDCMIEHGIRPWMTIYHWDLPACLQRRGGWMNEQMPEWFAEYTGVLADRFGDRVKDYFTINEPQCIIGLGYSMGVHAPGLKLGVRDQVIACHNLLKSHGRACQVLREKVKDVRIGYAPCCGPAIPEDENKPEDVEAARKAFFSVIDDPCFMLTWMSDPVILGSYPEDGLKLFGKYLPEGWQKDMSVICQKLDFYTQNVYRGAVYRAADNENGWEKVPLPRGYSRTAIGWEITPAALYWGPKFLWERYKVPFMISENGMSCHDTVMLDGKVHDPNRIDYTHRYLRELRRASEDGADIRGYFYWSFMDNFEWSYGYTERFGLVYVDYATGKRIPKDSLSWYAETIRTNGENL
jgi:beta-glucosidase